MSLSKPGGLSSMLAAPTLSVPGEGEGEGDGEGEGEGEG